MKFKTIFLFLCLLSLASAVFSSDEKEWSTEPYGSRMCLLPRPGTTLIPAYDPIKEFGACISELERLCMSAEKIDNAADSSAVEELKETTLKSVKEAVKKWLLLCMA
ncbi:MAG: hypothetical protein K2Q34_06730 [Alphaproteobacteria bacterium]|nr:hypothetical protein [Alphaproteobacteria bacterium]